MEAADFNETILNEFSETMFLLPEVAIEMYFVKIKLQTFFLSITYVLNKSI